MNNVSTCLCRPPRSTAPALVPPPEIPTGSTQLHVDNGSARLRVPAKSSPAPSNVPKKFARWYRKSRRGRLATNPNLKDVTNILEKYFAGFQRLAEMEIRDELRKDVYLYIRNTLVRQGYATTKEREKRLFDIDDLISVLVSLRTEADSVPSNKTQPPVLTAFLSNSPLRRNRHPTAESLTFSHVARPPATQRQRADGCLSSRGKEHAEIEIATFRDQEHDKHYSKDPMQLLATYRNMVSGGDVRFPKESLQRLSVVCVEAVQQGLLAD